MGKNNNSVWLIACRPSGIIAILLAFGIALIMSSNASAANLVLNGDFETGSFTNWDTLAVHFTVTGPSAHTGSYGVRDYISAGPYIDDNRIGFWQDVNLTDVDDLTFYYSVNSYAPSGQALSYPTVCIDSSIIWSGYTGACGYTFVNLDVSSYSGIKTIGFGDSVSCLAGDIVSVVYFDDVSAISEEPAQYITWTTYPPDSWKVGNYSALVIGVPEEYKNFVFEYKTPSSNYTIMPIQKNIVPKTFNCAEGKWYYWFSKSVYHSTYGNYSCRITHPEMETETKTVSVPYFDPDVTLPPVVIIPVPDIWVDPPQWNVTIPDKYQNVSWLTDYTVFWDGIGNSTNYTLYATVGLLLTPFEMLNSSISTVHEYATTAGGMIAGFEHTAIIIKVGWDIIPDDIQNIFIGTAALGIVIFIYHRRT